MTIFAAVPLHIPQLSVIMGVLKSLEGTTYYLWHYVPSLVLSTAFAALYLAAGCLIGIRMYKTKTWFCSSFVIGCFCKLSYTL
jgi:hypothetical protein